jgi:hypothetical protein
MSVYDQEVYQRNFARLLNRAIKAGQGDATMALMWLDSHYRPIWTILFSKHKAEMTDAYLDAREHLIKRIETGVGEK